MNKKVYCNAVSLFITSFLIIAAGIFLFLKSKVFLTAFHLTISILFMVIGLFEMISFISSFRRSKISIAQLLLGIASIALGVVVLCNRRYFLLLFPILFAMYALFNAVVRMVVFYIYQREQVKGKFFALLSALFSFTCCLVLLSNPFMNIEIVFKVSAVYMILYGTTYFDDFLRTIRESEGQEEKHRRIRFTLPVFWEAILPYKMLGKINRTFQRHRSKEEIALPKEGMLLEKSDMEIFIHVSDQNFGIVGHMDFYFDNTIVSYGSYDESTQKLHAALGDGVIFFAEGKDQYIQFCKEHSHKTIFSFGLRLTKEQKERVRDKIREIREDLIPWTCPIADPENAQKPVEDFTDYASELYKVIKPSFFKFREGEFKRYFVFRDNCVQLADRVIGALGTDIIGFSGIICPGTYYDYLDREFLRRNSMVISKTIYHT